MKTKFTKKTVIPLILFVLCLALPLVLRSNYYLQVACNVLMYCYFASSWNIIGGLAGQFAMGNGLYIGIGAYCCAIAISEGSTPYAAIPVAIVVSILLSIGISSLCFRLSGTYFALSTVAFLYVARYIMVGTDAFLGFKTNAGKGMTIPWIGGWKFLQFQNKAYYYYIFLFMVVVALIITNRIMNTRMGTYLVAIRTNQGAAATIGVPVTRYKMYAQCISAVMMALGGIMYACMIMQVDPYFVLGYDLSLQVMIFAVIGGTGTLWGPVVGAAILMLFKEVVRVNLGSSYAQFAQVLFGVMLCLCILFASGGLVGLANKFQGSLKSKTNKKPELQAKGKES